MTLFLSDRVGLALHLLGLLIQAVITLLWTSKGTRTIRITGVSCSALIMATILVVGSGRVFLGMLAFYSGDVETSVDNLFGGSITDLRGVLAATAITCLAALTATLLLRKFPTTPTTPPLAPTSTPLQSFLVRAPRLAEYYCVAFAAFTIACCLPQVPTAGRWLTTALAIALALTELLRPRPVTPSTPASRLLTATITVATVNLLVCLFQPDVLQLGLIAAIVSALAVIAAWRGRLNLTAAAMIASFSAQLAILLGTADGLLNLWTGGVTLAVVGACAVAIACLYIGRPPEAALMTSAASAVMFATLVIAMTSPDTGTGVVLTIAAAPLVAYGMQPGRRDALLLAGLLLIFANTAFVLGSDASAPEWFTLPPAVVMLAIGLLRWRDQHSWVFLGPGLLLGLVPSALLATGEDGFLRLTFVVAAALVIILVGVRFSLQAPFVIGAAVLAKIGLWQFLEVAPLIPRWITLALAGAILLTVGATYERRLTQAKQAARWITALR